MADQAVLQYDALVLQNELEAALQQAQANLVGVVDADDKPELDALVANLVGGIQLAATLADAIATPPPVVPPDPPIDPPVAMPDLVVDSVNPPATLKVGVPAPLLARVRNAGTAATPTGVAIGVGFLVNGKQVSWAASPLALAPGANRDLTTDGKPNGGTWIPDTAGQVTIVANVDDVNRIRETDAGETNNTRSITVTVLPADTPPVVVPPVTGPRGDVRLFPFQGGDNVAQRCHFSNMPLGDGAKFDTRPIPGYLNTNTTHWGLSIGGAGYPFVDQDRIGAPTAPPEGHVSIIRPDQLTVDDYYRYGFPNQQKLGPYKLTDGDNKNINMGASGLCHMWGCIRKADLDKGVINHALHLSINGIALDKNLTHVWPAYRVDGSAASTYKGFVPIGALLALPWDAVMPAGLTAYGRMVWKALREFGGYVSDLGGAVMAEATCQGLVNGGDTNAIMPHLRMVTNNTKDGITNLGGPGARRAAYLAKV